jgi:serine/threonine-protein kinase/endoribonuclease IRE1
MIKSKLHDFPDLNSKKPIKDFQGKRRKSNSKFKIKEKNKNNTKESSGIKKGTDDLALRREDIFNEIFIPEPTEDGNIFVMKPGEDLHVLPFSIKALIEQAPFAQNENIYLGSKTTNILVLNLYTGKLIKSYSMDSSFGFKENSDVIHIGRVDYKLIIKDSLTGKTKWNVSYSEYTTANFDEQQAAEFTNSEKSNFESLSASANAQGDLIIHEKGSEKYLNFKFSSPVLSTFSVSSTKNGDQGEKLRLSKAKPIWPKEQFNNSKKAFIGSIDGNLYALSSEKFPNFQSNIDDRLALNGSPNNKLSIYYPDNKYIGLEQNISNENKNKGNKNKKEKEVIEEVGNDDRYNEYNNEREQDKKGHNNNNNKFSNECHYGSPYFPACLLGEKEYYEDYNLILENRNELCDTDESFQSISQNILNNTTNGIREVFNFVGKIVLSLGFCAMITYSLRNKFISFEKDQKSIIGYKMNIMEKSAIVNHFIGLLQNLNKSQLPIDIDINNNYSSLSTDDIKSKEITEENITTERDLLNKIKVVGNSLKNNNINEDDPKASINEITKLSITEKSDSSEQKINESQYPLNIGSLVINDEVLGYGSHGTIVFKGTFQGRQVAVKRLLIDFYDIAAKEVQLLQESDDHPNVIRYFARETTDKFMYIAIELCMASLQDIIEKPNVELFSKIKSEMKPEKLLYQIISGIQHLHSLKIVHRDIKPQNILIAAPKKNQKYPRILLSDFGLCKKLDENQSSFNNTIHMAAGTVGWRAPEALLLANLGPNRSCDTSSLTLNSDTSSSYYKITQSQINMDDHPEPLRITKAIDIFAAGCVFFYVLTNGQHPFGDRYYREANIINGRYDLNNEFNINVEAKDLIEHMIQGDYRKRPSAKSIMSHPYFWSPTQRLNFLQEASDRFEIEPRDPPSPLLQLLETNAKIVVSGDWYKVIDKALRDNLGKYRKYNGESVRDLLRSLRNKKHHYQDLPDYVKEALGPIPDGFLEYFTSRFPYLLLHIYYIIVNTKILRNDPIFESYLNTNPE